MIFNFLYYTLFSAAFRKTTRLIIIKIVIQAKYKVYKSDRFSTEEHVVPTCSYRMGTLDMGFGVAILSKYR